MKKIKTKYILYSALLALALIAVIYSTVALIMDGSPLMKSTREHLKNGNEFYKDSLYNEAIEPYRRAMDREPENPIASYNSATNLLMKNYKDLKDNVAEPEVVANIYNDANQQFSSAAGYESEKKNLASIFHNSGLIYHLTDSLEMAAESYKEALRNNPDDDETRYNLAVVLHLLKQNQQDQQQNQEQQQDQQQSQEQQQNQQQNEEKQQQQPQAAQGDKEMSKENAERLLNAAMQDEKGVLEKVKREENRSRKRSLEKNW